MTSTAPQDPIHSAARPGGRPVEPEPAQRPALSPDAHHVCQTVTKASRSNFAYAFLVLPKPKREALYAIYAFCRISDDVVDEAPAPSPAGVGTPAERLQAWRDELDACFRGAPRHPVMCRLAQVLETIPIPRAYFDELLTGVEMDLTPRRYATFAELERYCYRVAGVVGLMCIEVFGYTQPDTRRYAECLGTAFQLTNILRDLGRDGAIGRIYLPQEDLARFGCTEADILERRLTPAFRDLMKFQTARAHQFYDAARAALPAADRRPMLPAEIMRAIYACLLREIENRSFDVYSRPVRLSDTRRLALALGCWARQRLIGWSRS